MAPAESDCWRAHTPRLAGRAAHAMRLGSCAQSLCSTITVACRRAWRQTAVVVVGSHAPLTGGDGVSIAAVAAAAIARALSAVALGDADAHTNAPHTARLSDRWVQTRIAERWLVGVSRIAPGEATQEAKTRSLCSAFMTRPSATRNVCAAPCGGGFEQGVLWLPSEAAWCSATRPCGAFEPASGPEEPHCQGKRGTHSPQRQRGGEARVPFVVRGALWRPPAHETRERDGEPDAC